MPARCGDGSAKCKEGGHEEGSEDRAIWIFKSKDDRRVSTIDLLRSTCPARRLGEAEAHKCRILDELSRQSQHRIDSAA